MFFSFRKQAVTALAGLALIIAALAITASANVPGLSPSAPAATGSTYVEAVVGAPRFVNPLLSMSDTDTDLAHLVFSGLTRVDSEGNIALDMASEWQVSPDGRVYTFTLKPDLKWHDGKPVTSDDLIATFGLLRALDFPGDPALVARWRDITVEAPSLQAVRFTLLAPNASFLQFTTLGMLPKHLWSSVKPAEMVSSDLNQSPVGSGPWRYVRDEALSPGAASNRQGTPVPGGISPAEGVLLERNRDLTSTNSRIARLWFRIYPTFGAALSGFKMGEAHGLGHIPSDRVGEVEAVPGVTLHKESLARYTMLILNLRSPLFDKVETRKAVELAIDREALIAGGLGGLGRPLESPILPGSWAHDPSIKVRGYDPAEARRLLDSAGWKLGAGGVRVRDGVTLTVALAANKELPANVEVAEQITGYLKAVGIDAQLALVGRDALLREYLNPRAFHIVLAGWEANGADPDVFQYWHSSQANVQGGLNFSGWSNAQADEALQGALLTQDKEERTKRYLSFQQAFYADVPSVILYSPLYTYATRSPAMGVTLPSTDIVSPAARFDTFQGWSLAGSR
ncbi:MAG TPA: ABC transporter substrate-binding protein [Chloroflexia bacterium]|nr:ABC transporter substrate-binding protein [Chloroflexia bacterium]